MKIRPDLSFNGNAEEALNFYADVFNGTVGELHRYKDYKDIEGPVGYEDKIIYSDLNFNDCSFSVADLLPETKANFGSLGHTITVFCDTEEQLKDIYTKLGDGGQIKCALSQPCYAKLYAEVIDKFGVLWALIIE